MSPFNLFRVFFRAHEQQFERGLKDALLRSALFRHFAQTTARKIDQLQKKAADIAQEVEKKGTQSMINSSSSTSNSSTSSSNSSTSASKSELAQETEKLINEIKDRFLRKAKNHAIQTVKKAAKKKFGG